MNDLKPCPLCGGSNLEVVDTPQGYFIGCSCGCFTGDFETEAEAIDVWNTRVQIPGEVCEVEGIGETGPLPLIEERTCEAKLCCDGFYRCTECGHVMLPFSNYCSKCGAKVMRHG